MTVRLDVSGLVSADVERGLNFCRTLGCMPPRTDDAADGGDGSNVDISHGGGRLMIDTEEGMRSFDPQWQRSPVG